MGTARIANQNRKFKGFYEAREFAHKLNLKTQAQWSEYCKSGSKPMDIPANPARTYGGQWAGFGDWLGTGRTRKGVVI